MRSYRLVNTPLHFGRAGTERFDAPDGRFGVCYAGEDDASTFIETFGHVTGRRVVTASELVARGRARLTTSRPLRLVDLTGPGLARLDADNALAAGCDYALSQSWSAALWAHPGQPDGLPYLTRHDPALRSVALFDRETWPALARLLDRYDFGLIDDR